MWGDVEDKKKALEQAVVFTSNHKLYGKWMMKVVSDWPISCENALTDSSLGQKAWIGHAAVAYALQIPEDIVRKAWGLLDDNQRKLANREARKAIQVWQSNYTAGDELHSNVARQMLLQWDT